MSISTEKNFDLDEKRQDCYSFDEELPQLKSWQELLMPQESMIYDPSLHLKLLEEAESQSRLFSSPEKMKFDILDIFDHSDPPTHPFRSRKETFTSMKNLDNFLSQDFKPTARYISISAPNSVRPLQITSEATRRLLAALDIGPAFLDLLLSFANGGTESEAGPGSLTYKTLPGGGYEMQYRFNYVESAAKGSSWASRQIGIYNKHQPHPNSPPLLPTSPQFPSAPTATTAAIASGTKDIWIFLHPKNDSLVQRRLETAMTSPPSSSSSSSSSFPSPSSPPTTPQQQILIHLLILSSYLPNWRWFIKSLSAETELLASDALSLDFSTEAHVKRGLDALQGLHSLQDKVLPLTPRLRSLLATVEAMRAHGNVLFREDFSGGSSSSTDGKKSREMDAVGSVSAATMAEDELRSYETQIRGLLANVDLVEKRVQEILKLLGVALSLKNQATTTNINRNILSLTRDSVDDSATVRVVTVVTLIYLPASFTTSLFGMNLFSYGSPSTTDDSGFQISSQFWIFLALTLPLTFLTVGSWYWMARRRKRQKSIQKAARSMTTDA